MMALSEADPFPFHSPELDGISQTSLWPVRCRSRAVIGRMGET
jgi:hypothetical protein